PSSFLAHFEENPTALLFLLFLSPKQPVACYQEIPLPTPPPAPSLLLDPRPFSSSIIFLYALPTCNITQYPHLTGYRPLLLATFRRCLGRLTTKEFLVKAIFPSTTKVAFLDMRGR
ncbi:uncharacterized protein CLUP02_13938, partial [Colletotrichum lupini]